MKINLGQDGRIVLGSAGHMLSCNAKKAVSFSGQAYSSLV